VTPEIFGYNASHAIDCSQASQRSIEFSYAVNRELSDRLMHYCSVLVIFLALSLATQAPDLGAQTSSGHTIIAKSRGAGLSNASNTDFDDEQRGLKSLALPSVQVPITFGTMHDCFHVNDTCLYFRLAGVPLFKLHAVLLI
jgi:hypothetical protein